MLSIRTLLVCSFATGTLAVPFGNAVLKEILNLPSGWTEVGIPLSTDQIRLSFALKQNNIEGLLTKLHDIADPDSADFRQWLTLDQVAAYSAPAPGTVSNVISWLASNGVPASSVHQTMDMLQVSMPIAQAELLLGTKYLLYNHRFAPTPIPRALSYFLPASLHSMIDTVQPTTAFLVRTNAEPVPGTAPSTDLPNLQLGTPLVGESPTRTANKRASTTTCYPDTVFPSCVLAKYSSDYVGTNRDGAQTATYGGANPANRTDADIYRRFLALTTTDFNDIALDGYRNTGATNTEGNLDTQINMGMASNNQAYYITSPPGSDFYLELANYLQVASAPPAVSLSYGGDETAFSGAYMTRVCNLFAQAGAQGVTLFVASGDDGVGGSGGNCAKFQPSFPPTCPYVTAVGATVFVNSGAFVPFSKDDQGEQVAQYGSTGGSGGGFSNYFGQPSWQASAVNGYIGKLNGQYDGFYNKSGRAYPDVSAIGYSWFNVINGLGARTYGTSCSSPAWAGMLSLLNDYRISQGKAKLGWVNPTFYKYSYYFGDITKGNNRGCNGDGFPALSGWDAATGLGTPILPYLRVGI